jgi:hypothetical protein
LAGLLSLYGRRRRCEMKRLVAAALLVLFVGSAYAEETLPRFRLAPSRKTEERAALEEKKPDVVLEAIEAMQKVADLQTAQIESFDKSFNGTGFKVSTPSVRKVEGELPSYSLSMNVAFRYAYPKRSRGGRLNTVNRVIILNLTKERAEEIQEMLVPRTSLTSTISMPLFFLTKERAGFFFGENLVITRSEACVLPTDLAKALASAGYEVKKRL